MRIVADSPGKPKAPISMLLSPVVRRDPAPWPNAMLKLPVVLLKRAGTEGRVEVAGSVASEGTITVGRVGIPIDVVYERISAGGRVGVAGGVEKERTLTDGRVGGAGGVV